MPEPSATAPALGGGAFHVQPASPRAILRLKSWLASRSGTAPLRPLGCELPDEVGAVTEGTPRVLCTGPGEWLMICAPTSVARLRDVLAPELAAQALALVDLTAGLATFEVSGSDVREVLGKSCGLDFDLHHFQARRCARTRFAQIPVVIECIEDSGVFELYAPRSYGHYLETWLWDSTQESRGG